MVSVQRGGCLSSASGKVWVGGFRLIWVGSFWVITVIVRVTGKVSPVKCDLVGWTVGGRVSDSVVNC